MMTDAEKHEEIELIKSDIADYEAEIDKINGYQNWQIGGKERAYGDFKNQTERTI